MKDQEKQSIIHELLNAKADNNNTIDLNAYASGLRDMIDRLHKTVEVEDFVVGKEYGIGDIFMYEGIRCKCVEVDECNVGDVCSICIVKNKNCMGIECGINYFAKA